MIFATAKKKNLPYIFIVKIVSRGFNFPHVKMTGKVKNNSTVYFSVKKILKSRVCLFSLAIILAISELVLSVKFVCLLEN